MRKNQTLHSLGELENWSVPVEVEDVESFDVQGLDIEELENRAEKVRQNAGKVRTMVQAILRWLDQVSGLSQEAFELLGDKVAEAQKRLDGLINHVTSAYRRVAWETLLVHEFSKELRTREGVEKLLEKLVETRKLVSDPAGNLKAYGRAYTVSKDSGLRPEELADVEQALENLLQRVFAEVGKTREEKSRELSSQSTIGWKEFVSGKLGKCFLQIPPEHVRKNGEDFWRGGGNLLVKSDGQKIVPIEAVGAIEKIAKEIREERIHLLVISLGASSPPFVKALGPDQGRRVALLWHLIKRAIRAEEETEKFSAIRQEFVGRATITSEEFFLGKKTGVCFIEFHGVWETPEGEKISNLFLLVERKEKETSSLSVVAVPSHLNDFFAPCLGKEYDEGDKFEGVGQPLQAILKAVFGQALHNGATKP